MRLMIPAALAACSTNELQLIQLEHQTEQKPSALWGIIVDAPECFNDVSPDIGSTKRTTSLPQGVVPALVEGMAIRGAHAECWYDNWSNQLILWVRKSSDRELLWTVKNRWSCVNSEVNGRVKLASTDPVVIVQILLSDVDEKIPGWNSITHPERGVYGQLQLTWPVEEVSQRDVLCVLQKNDVSPYANFSGGGWRIRLPIPVFDELPQLSQTEVKRCMSRRVRKLSAHKWCGYEYPGTAWFSL